ncbi:MAG: SBBP repeat-containing protein, partial [Candidatus Competibacter sp.]|nr:SBBP repeat-containing protein [Candidatus Competibacter sp.]
AYRGATEVTLTDAGRLAVRTPVGRFEEDRPLVWQDIAGQRVPVEARYTLAQAGEGEWRYGFALGTYDPSRPLVIDPVVLVYCGFIGGGGVDWGNSIAMDDLGQAYVVGSTSSTEASFPVIGGPDLTYNGGENGGEDAFVAKVSADGTHLVYASYIGGGDWDEGSGIAVDGSGQAYVVGTTSSTESTFPVVGGPDLTFNGRLDAFVAKVSADGTRLVYAGYIGGSDSDEIRYGNGIAVDGSGQAYVVGSTSSTQSSFPVVGGPDLIYNGGKDAFVAKVSVDGTRLVYAGYIGGSGYNYGVGIAVDGLGQAYVVGVTESNLRVVGGPDLTFNGYFDAFVAKVSADGTRLVYAGYIGGSGEDSGNSIAVDSLGQAYVTGYTTSTEASFPVVGGPDLTFNGGGDAFVAKVSADGTHLVYAGYIGGGGVDWGNSIAMDDLGQAYVTGSTTSTEASFPVVGGPDLTHNGSEDVFVAKVSTDGTHLGYAGYIGGNSSESGFGIAVDGLGQAYVVGWTFSGETSFPVVGGPYLTYNGDRDTFVAKLAEDPGTDRALDLEAAPDPVSAGQPLTYTLTVANNGPQDAPGSIVTDTLPAGVIFGSASSGCSHDGATTVTCALDALGVGARARVTLVVVPTTQAIGAIRNRAVVSTGFDPDPSNNSATVTTTVDPPAEQADLALTLDDDPDPVLSWEPLTYTLTVTNAGPSTAAGVVLADTLPPGLAVLALSSGCSHAGGTVTCVLGDVAKNATVQASIRVAPHRWRPTLRNTATVRSAATWDPDPNNNWAHQTTAMWLGGGAGLGILVNGTGSVRSEPTGIQCPGDCGERYPAGTTVVLSAAPAAQFVGWEGACAGTAPTLPVVLGGATLQVCQANFAEPTGQLGDSGGLGMFVNGPGSVRSEPAGLTCPGDCRASYPADTTVVLSAEPTAQFLGWEGACAGTAPTLPVVVAGATTQFCQANFAEPTPAP